MKLKLTIAHYFLKKTKFIVFSSLGLISVLSLTALTVSSPKKANAQSANFLCSRDANNIPTTYILVPEGQIPLFSWQSTYFPPPYTPMRRCTEVTERLINFQNKGILREFYGGKAKTGEGIICAGKCNSDGSNIIYTLKPDQNPKDEIAKLIAHKTGKTNNSLFQSNDTDILFDLEDYIEDYKEKKLGESNAPVNSQPPSQPISPPPGNNNSGSRWGN